MQASEPGSACKIYVLDAAEVAEAHGLRTCDPSEVVVDSKTQARWACTHLNTSILMSWVPPVSLQGRTPAGWFHSGVMGRVLGMQGIEFGRCMPAGRCPATPSLGRHKRRPTR